MRKEKAILIKNIRWNGVCEGGEFRGIKIWDNEYNQVEKELKDEFDLKIIIKEV